MNQEVTISLRSKMLLLLAALSITAKIISGQNILLVLFLLICFYGILTEEIEGKIIFLLFFSPWIYVLKLDAHSFSFFHVLQLIYLLSVIFTLLRNKIELNLKVMVGFSFFALIIVLFSGFNQNSNPVLVFGFLLNFFIITFAIATMRTNKYYAIHVLSFAYGVLISGFIGLLGNWVPQIQYYIQNMGEVYTLFENNQLYTRFRGLDLDPNYFSLQVLLAISLLFVLSSSRQSHWKESILILLLIVMGLSTLSKMFFLLLILILTYTCILYIKVQFMNVLKYVVVVGVVLLSSLPLGLFDYISLTVSRFSDKGNTALSVTTGRSQLWLSYLDEILSNPLVFLVGKGIGTGFLNEHAAHNMYLSFWYFTGFLGMIAFSIFFCFLVIHMKKLNQQPSMPYRQGLTYLPLLVLLTANLSLDSIVMDFFPLMLFLTLSSMPSTVDWEDSHRSSGDA